MPGDVRERAESKLATLDAASSLEDLKVPPGNRLEALGGDRSGQHSIRISFDEEHGEAHEVEITDYH